MKRIRRAGTAPELAVATILRDLGVRYRMLPRVEK
jgi:G:T-mismatch repair DNA endonuclease (very short patch repair protein)